MLNLNRYHERAQYPPGTTDVDVDVSGREAYLRYGVVAFAAIQSVGGEILWATDAAETVIGCEHDGYDEVVAVWYPSRSRVPRPGRRIPATWRPTCIATPRSNRPRSSRPAATPPRS